MFPGGSSGGDPFASMFGMMNQMNGMMNQMLQDPFFGMPPPVGDRCFAPKLLQPAVLSPCLALLTPPMPALFVQQAPPQNYQQYPQTAPRIEEVPHDAAPNRSSGAYLVEEPGGGVHALLCKPTLARLWKCTVAVHDGD